MKHYETSNLRNFAIVGHGAVGKTTLAEAMLSLGNEINRMGSVDLGTTVSDYHPGEKDRKISSGDLIVMSSSDDVKVILIVPSQKRVPEQTVAVLSSKFTPKEATERNLMILISNFNKETKYLMDCLVLAGYSHVAYLL